MKTAFEELDSPYLESELGFTVPIHEMSHSLERVIGESPFANSEDLRETETGQPWHSGVELPELETLGPDEPFAETWLEEKPEVEEDSAYPDRESNSNPETVVDAEGGYTGDDDRTEVRDTTISPYRWICSVSYEKDGQTLNGGTGFLISNRHVLTAGHVITEAGSGPAAPSIYVYPGRHYGGEPFGKFSVAKTRVSAARLDFGLITLNRPVDQGVLWWGHPDTTTAWWSEALLPAQQLLRTAIPISTAGYPGVKDAYRRRMYQADGSTIPGAFGAIFRHTADTTQGQSGSPIWTVRNGLHVLLGIATSYDQRPGQRATWVGILRRDIERWMAEDAPKALKVERRIALEVPYRWICRVEVYDNDLRREVGYGTGLLISNRHVVTAARVIHDFSRDRRRYSVRITPAYEFGKEAFGSTTASKARVSPKFSPETKDGSADYGLLTLARPLGSAVFSALGNTALGNWGNESHGLSTTPADLSGKAAHIAAFSRSSGGGAGYHKLRVSTGAIVGLQRGQILQKASSKLDAPGAPIWIEVGKRRLLVGIVSSVFSKNSTLNLGCYLSQETQNQLMQWVNLDHEQTELEVRDLSQDELELVMASPDTAAEDWVGETNPEPDAQGEYLEAESKSDFFGDAEERRSSFDYDQLKDEGALDELEGEADWEAKKVWEELEEEELTSQANKEEDESLDDEGAFDWSPDKEQEREDSEIEDEDFPGDSFVEERSSERDPNSRSRVSSVVDPFPRPIIMSLDMAITMSRDNSKVEFGNCIEAASQPADVSSLCGAVIDLTGDPDLPPYAGHNDTDMLYVGSLAKIYPLLAAFELRRRVTRQAKDMIKIGLSTTAGWENKVFGELKKGWQSKLDAIFRGRGLPSGFPNLAKVLELSPDGTAELRQEFLGWIRAALGQNDEPAVGKYIRALSYPYINGVLAAAGFFKPAVKTGLWISGDYNGNDWLPKDGAGVPLTARWRSSGHAVSNFTGTALQVARFLGLMAQGKLVDKDSSREMIGLLGTPFLHKTLSDATPSPRPFSLAVGKVGIGTWDNRYHDSAIVRIERGGDPARTISYALAVLGSPNGAASLRKLELPYHDCVVARHP